MRRDPPGMVSGRDLASETSPETSATADSCTTHGRAAIYGRVESGLIVRASALKRNDFGLNPLQSTCTRRRMPRMATPLLTEESRSLRAFAPALILLAISFLINYVDRGNVSVAGPILKSEFHLSGTQLGILFAAFFVSYTGMQFVMGWLVDH